MCIRDRRKTLNKSVAEIINDSFCDKVFKTIVRDNVALAEAPIKLSLIHIYLGATFLSGTVVVNALTELYVMFKYLRPQELQRQRISCFDAVSYTHLRYCHT